MESASGSRLADWKSHKEDTVDWNEQSHGQEWRTGWETVQNRYLEMVNSPVRVDLRSYEKQGLDIIPTVHMGAAVTQMERRGIQTNIGNLNRDIKAANRMMTAIRSTIQNLRDWLSDILKARQELLAEKTPQDTSPDLINLLRDYLNLRKAERRDWSRYGQQKGTSKDLKSFVTATNYLKEHEIFTLEKLDSALEEVKQKSSGIRTSMRTAECRMKVITGIQNAVADCQQHQAVHDKYVRIGWKTAQSIYAESHRDELDAYNKAYRFLKKNGVDLNVNLDALQAEYEQLQTSHAAYTEQLAAVQEELKPMQEIRYWVSKVLSPEQAEVKTKPEPKHSVTEQIKDYQEESRKKDEQHRQEKNMER
jgi:predicted  nucleic acid-binding Zn-ribbon protein